MNEPIRGLPPRAPLSGDNERWAAISRAARGVNAGEPGAQDALDRAVDAVTAPRKPKSKPKPTRLKTLAQHGAAWWIGGLIAAAFFSACGILIALNVLLWQAVLR